MVAPSFVGLNSFAIPRGDEPTLMVGDTVIDADAVGDARPEDTSRSAIPIRRDC
jgi:hypothetical protein